MPEEKNLVSGSEADRVKFCEEILYAVAVEIDICVPNEYRPQTVHRPGDVAFLVDCTG